MERLKLSEASSKVCLFKVDFIHWIWRAQTSTTWNEDWRKSPPPTHTFSVHFIFTPFVLLHVGRRYFSCILCDLPEAWMTDQRTFPWINRSYRRVPQQMIELVLPPSLTSLWIIISSMSRNHSLRLFLIVFFVFFLNSPLLCIRSWMLHTQNASRFSPAYS